MRNLVELYLYVWIWRRGFGLLNLYIKIIENMFWFLVGKLIEIFFGYFFYLF